MPQTDLSQQFFTDYGRYAYADGFLGKSPNAESVETVITRYKNNVTEHSLQHYELFTNSIDKDTLTSHNLLYYHIYGDYRMVIDSEDRAAYRYIAPPDMNSTDLRTHNLTQPPSEYFLRDYLRHYHLDRVNGIYNDVGNDGKLVFEFGDVPWLTQELSREGTGTKFNLPSIGTQIVKLHSFGNASQSIKEAMIGELLELVAFYERNYEVMPDFIKTETLPEVMRLINFPPASTMNENISDLFAIILSQMRNNPEYIALTGRTVDLNSSSINRAIQDIYNLQEDHDNESAVSKFVNTIFGSSTQKFVARDSVTLTFGATSNRLEQIADQLTDASDAEQYQYDTFEIDTFNVERGGYSIRHVGRDEAIEIYDDPRDPTSELYFFTDNDMRGLPTLDLENDTGDVQYTGGDTGNNNNRRKKKKKGGGNKTLQPAMVVYQRVILDTFAAIQAVIHLSDWAGFNTMEASIDRVRAENKMRFLSKGVNVYSVSKQNEKQGKDKKSKVNARTVYHTFPNITHFSATRIEGIEPKKDSKTANFGLLDEMVKWRTYYTLSILSGIRKKAFATQLLDNFYSSNMLIAEIKWLTSALAEGSKVLVTKRQDQDLLKQAQYRDMGNTRNVVQFAPAPLETVFYEVDVPLFKMVIAEYNDVYNKTIISRAFNVPTEVTTTYSERPDIFRMLKDAKSARNRDDRTRQGEILLRAMRLQPQAFIVDQPLGKSGNGNGDYPGLTYKPTGDKFRYHVRHEFIPSDIEGADRIPLEWRDNNGNRQTATLEDPVGTSFEIREISTKKLKTPNEGDLAKLVWTSARDRIKGIFDIEGVKPHEFMDRLFNRIQEDLDRSNVLRSPFPDAWLGTDTVNKLRTDPMYLGMAPDRKYYTERLTEYVDALKSKYINNWRVPTTLITMFENAMIKYTKDPDTLKNAFLERLERDADRANLVTTNYIMRPYQITIAIMRSVLQVPLAEREMYTAEEIDDQMRRDIQDHLASGEVKPILPTAHPLYSQFEPRRPPVAGARAGGAGAVAGGLVAGAVAGGLVAGAVAGGPIAGGPVAGGSAPSLINKYITINQVEVNPYFPNTDAINASHANRIVTMAFTPLGSNSGLLTSEPVLNIAVEHDISTAEVLLQYAETKAVDVIYKTSNIDRLSAVDLPYVLTEQNIAELDSLAGTYGDYRFGASGLAPGPAVFGNPRMIEVRYPVNAGEGGVGNRHTRYLGSWGLDLQNDLDGYAPKGISTFFKAAFELGWDKIDTSEDYIIVNNDINDPDIQSFIRVQPLLSQIAENYNNEHEDFLLKHVVTKIDPVGDPQDTSTEYDLSQIEDQVRDIYEYWDKPYVETIDILLHWPAANHVAAYKKLREVIANNLPKNITGNIGTGVSNYGPRRLQELIESENI